MTAERWIVVRNWDRFQHYRDRDPTWIKVYVALLSDDDFLDLSLATRGYLVGVWILYARSRGVLSVSRASRELVGSASDARRVREHLESLCEAGFLEVSASRPVPFRYPRDRGRDRDREEKSSPISPRSGDSNGRENPRALGTNPRAQGTNPRAVAERSREERHFAMVSVAWEQSSSWDEGRTDLLHERLDEIEREHGAQFSDQEREEIVDAVLERVYAE